MSSDSNSRKKTTSEEVNPNALAEDKKSIENEQIRRGIELGRRILQSRLGKTISKNFAWWRGGRLNKISLLLLTIVFIINLIIIVPLLQRDVTASYNSSALLGVARIVEYIKLASKSQFFTIVTIIFLSFAPISIYLFTRKIVLRHDLIAFTATLFFILPVPLIKNGSPLVEGMLNSDGAHVLAFSFIPFLLLFFQSHIITGSHGVGVFTILSSAIIAIISPFAMFNLLILFSVITISEGFLGQFRLRATRMIGVILNAFLLSLFWYFPNFFAKIILMEHLRTTISKLWSIFPIAIPIIPISAIIFFLIFDRREKLKPIFIAISLLIIYFILYSMSSSLAISGLFTAERYVSELNFAIALIASLGVILVGELLVRKYIFNDARHSFKVLLFILSCVGVILWYGIITAAGIKTIHGEIATSRIRTPYHEGIGSFQNSFSLSVLSFIGGAVSLIELLHLLGIIKSLSLRHFISSRN